MTLPPVTFVNAQQQPQGFDVEFGDMLGGRLGLKTKWINVAFSGIVPALLAGQCDAIVSALYIQPSGYSRVREPRGNCLTTLRKPLKNLPKC